MDISQLLNQFLGTGQPQSGTNQIGAQPNKGSGFQIPAGMSGALGGAAAGSIVALLMGNKGARKVAGKAATYGGMAVLGGLAFKAFQNWQANRSLGQAEQFTERDFQTMPKAFLPEYSATSSGGPSSGGSVQSNQSLELAVLKSMIAAAKADGHIDSSEMRQIHERIEMFNLSREQKELVFSSLDRDVAPSELAALVSTIEHRSEVYLASCLVCGSHAPQERAYLDKLSQALSLPEDLKKHLEYQARAVMEPA